MVGVVSTVGQVQRMKLGGGGAERDQKEVSKHLKLGNDSVGLCCIVSSQDVHVCGKSLNFRSKNVVILIGRRYSVVMEPGLFQTLFPGMGA